MHLLSNSPPPPLQRRLPHRVRAPSPKRSPPKNRLPLTPRPPLRPGSADPVGGIPRFQTLVNHYRHHPAYDSQPQLLTLFSGDAFNPSLESAVTKGSHMVPVLNAVGVDVACVGVRTFGKRLDTSCKSGVNEGLTFVCGGFIEPRSRFWGAPVSTSTRPMPLPVAAG